MSNMKLVLASQSEGRKALLEMINAEFEIIPSCYVEDMSINLAANDLVLKFSEGKALDVVKARKDSIVIGADTIVEVNNKVIGKPRDRHQAFNYLEMMNGKIIKVLTGMTIINTSTQEKYQDVTKTKIQMINYTEKDIEEYINTEEPYTHAGGFKIQGRGALFIKEINGDLNNAIGLSLTKLNEILKTMDYKL